MANKLYIVEARDSAGRLQESPENPPPFKQASQRQLQEFHDEETGNYMAEFPSVLAWFARQGWAVRERPY